MLATEAPATPTGLDPADLAGLSDSDVAALAAWHRAKAGDDNGRPWWPNAVRALPLDARLELAADPVRDAAWEERERRRVVADPVYFTEAYGHVQPEEGEALPFTLWPEQRGVLLDLVRHLRVVILKARQLGLTWLALHFAVWLLVFCETTPNARILCLSKHGGDATKLLERARRIIALLPPFLRPVEDRDTERSLTKLHVVGRGRMQSLPANPEAARMETATFVLADEFAFIRHKMATATWTAILGTLGRLSRVCVVSTGNGDAEQPGDGQAFAQLWQQARSQRTDKMRGGTLHPIFLPSSVHPERDEAWRAAKVQEFLTEDAFEQEYPETEAQGLRGREGLMVFPGEGINAAEALGAKFDALLARGVMTAPVGDVIDTGSDFGEFAGHIALWPLEGGGIYVPPVEVYGGGHRRLTVRESFRQLLDGLLQHVQVVREDELGADRLWPLIRHLRFDGAGVESMRTVVELVQNSDDLLDQFETRPGTVKRRLPDGSARIEMGRRVRPMPVPFNRYKVVAYDYLEGLLKRTAKGEHVQVIAISPKCKTLLSQMRGMERKDDGTIEKGNDHLPDALAAGAARVAATWGGVPEPTVRDDLDEAA